MKGDEKVIEFLNKALTNELTAINQYWLHYRVLADWGVSKLAEYERHESIDEMTHAARTSLLCEARANHFSSSGKTCSSSRLRIVLTRCAIAL